MATKRSMRDKSNTVTPDDKVVAVLSELTSAIEHLAELQLSGLRLTAQSDWEATKAVREATVAAIAAATAARSAEAAVNVFAEHVGTLNANIELLRHEIRNALGRVAGVEMVLDAGAGLRAEVPTKNRNGHDG